MSWTLRKTTMYVLLHYFETDDHTKLKSGVNFVAPGTNGKSEQCKQGR